MEATGTKAMSIIAGTPPGVNFSIRMRSPPHSMPDTNEPSWKPRRFGCFFPSD